MALNMVGVLQAWTQHQNMDDWSFPSLNSAYQGSEIQLQTKIHLSSMKIVPNLQGQGMFPPDMNTVLFLPS